MKTPSSNFQPILLLGAVLLTAPSLCVGQAARPISLVDPSFNPGTGPDGEVLSLAFQADGRILIGGDFRTVDGSPRSGVARLRQDGAVDPSFAPVIEQREDSPRRTMIRYVSQHLDGSIMVVGWFTHVNGVSRKNIARFLPDGSLDTAFVPPTVPTPYSGLTAVRCEVDGKLLIRSMGGNWTASGNTGRRVYNFAVLNADGSRDATWTANTITLTTERTLGETEPFLRPMVLQPDGKIVVGGRFESLQGSARKNLARLNPDGTVDSSFEIASRLELKTSRWYATRVAVTALALDARGRLIVCGAFDMIGGVERRDIARLNADGSVDLTFNAGEGPENGIVAVLPQADGTILVGGVFRHFNGAERNQIARLQSDGSLDVTFNSGRPPRFATVGSIAVQPDGAVVIGCSDTCCGLEAGFGASGLLSLTRLLPRNPPGTAFEIEPDFGGILFEDGIPEHDRWQGYPFTGPQDYYFSIVRTGDTSARSAVELITLAGTADGSDFTPVNTSLVFEPGETQKAVPVTIRDDEQPEPDETFRVVLSNPVNGIIQSGSGEARVTILDNERPGSAVRHKVGGFVNSGHNDGGLIVQPDGKVLMANSADREGLWRFNSDHTVDESFTPYTNSYHYFGPIALAPSGNILVVDRSGSGRIRRLNRLGLIDDTFQSPSVVSGGNETVLAVQPDDKVLVGGFRSLSRLNSNGTLDSALKPSIDGFISAISLPPDGKIIVGGWFSIVNGAKRDSLARLNADGSLDGSFDAGPISPLGPAPSERLAAIAQQPDGKLIVAGPFSKIGGVARNSLARLHVDGRVDATFDPGAGPDTNLETDPAANSPSLIQSLALQPDGKILVGGLFTSFDGEARNGIARLNADGSLDAAFDPGPIFGFAKDRGYEYEYHSSAGIRVLALLPNGNIAFAGGYGEGDGGLNCDARPFGELNGDRKYIRLTSALTRPKGILRLTVNTQPGLRYALETSVDLKSWLPLRTNTATGLTLEFEDANAPNFPRRFYRARLVAP